MSTSKHWHVHVHLTETGPADLERVAPVRTYAEATVDLGADGGVLRGHGDARKSPEDRDIPGIGDKIAAARALSELAYRLLEAAGDEISAATGELAVLRR